jgi:hypothetical protein
MLLGELREKLVVTEDHKSIYVDFRVFGDRQSVAMDLYLNGVLEIARINPIGTGKTLVLTCDRNAEITEQSRLKLREMQQLGQPVALRCGQQESK